MRDGGIIVWYLCDRCVGFLGRLFVRSQVVDRKVYLVRIKWGKRAIGLGEKLYVKTILQQL